MKKLLVVLAMALSIPAMAQNSEKKVVITPKVGLNISDMSNFENSESRYGLIAGADFEFKTYEKMAISAGLFYSQQGLSSKEYGLTGKIKMDYINIPVLYNYYVTDNFVLKVGLQAGFLVNDKMKITSNSVDLEMDLTEALKTSGEDFKCSSTIFSLPIAVAYNFGNVAIEARYDAPLSSAISTPDEKSTHRNISVTVGYRF